MRDERYRLYVQRLLFGIGTANFLALIQLIAAPQISSRSGITGMTLMCANIPLAFGWALYLEFTSLAGREIVPNPKIQTVIYTIGLIGMAMTFSEFNPIFGVVFIGVAWVVILAYGLARRRKPRDNTDGPSN